MPVEPQAAANRDSRDAAGALVPQLTVDRGEFDYLRLPEIYPYLSACAPYYRPWPSSSSGCTVELRPGLDVAALNLR